MEPEISKDMSAAEAPSVQPKKNELEDRRKLFLVLALLLLLTATTVAVIIILAQGSRKGGNAGDGGSSSTSTAITSSASATITSDTLSTGPQLPNGWTYVSGDACPVKIPVPPKELPYYVAGAPTPEPDGDGGNYYSNLDNKGMFWHLLPTSDTYIRYGLFGNHVNYFFTHDEPYRSNYLGNDFAPGYVDISCATNTVNPKYTALDLLERFKEATVDVPDSGYSLISATLNDKWGYEIYLVEYDTYLSRVTEYFLATPSNIYSIRAEAGSTVADAAIDIIVDNLQFDVE